MARMTEAEMEQFWANKKASNGHNFVANLEAAKRDGKTLRPWYEQDEAFAQKIIDVKLLLSLVLRQRKKTTRRATS